MEPLVIAGKAFQSRLIVGTGKYKDGAETQAAVEASGAEMVTVAVRRVNLDRSKESLLDFLDPQRYFLLPNTAGCYTADEAIRAAMLAREVGLSDWVKIEVIGDQATLYPDVQATLEATRVLVKEGFTVLPYTSDDIVFAKRLIDVGAAAVMPLGAPIGSGLGCGGGDGAGLRRGADEYGDRGGARPDPDGRGDAACGAGRAAGVPGRKDAA
jgi:thiazole synthase